MISNLLSITSVIVAPVMSIFSLIELLILWKICVSDAASSAVFAHSDDEAIPGYFLPLYSPPDKKIFARSPSSLSAKPMVYTVYGSFFFSALPLLPVLNSFACFSASCWAVVFHSEPPPVGLPSVKRTTYLGFLSSTASSLFFASRSPTEGSVPPFASNPLTNVLSSLTLVLSSPPTIPRLTDCP